MEEQEIRSESENQLSFQTLFLEVKKNIFLIILITLLFALAGAAYARFFVQTRYTSNASFMVNVAREDVNNSETTAYSYAIALTGTLEEFIKTSKVGEKAAEIYFEEYGKEIPQYSLSTSTTEKNFIIPITCSSTDKYSGRILKSVMDATMEVANELKGQDDKPTVVYNKFLVFEGADVNVQGRADSGAKMYKYILIFMLIGLVISAVVIILKILFNDTYKFKEDLEKDIPVEVLSLIDDLTHVKEDK